MRPVMLMNELQSVADSHAEILGAGRGFCLAKTLAWVATHYLVDVLELPRENEKLTLITWPSGHDGLKASRDFIIRGTDGRDRIRATSQWIMIDTNARKPIRMNDNIPHWDTIPERALDLPFGKFPDFTPTEPPREFAIRYDDIDVNQHVNNAIYALWATESVGLEFRDAHTLRKIFLNFKREISADTPGVTIETAIESTASGASTSRHKIKSGDTDNAYIVCEWVAS